MQRLSPILATGLIAVLSIAQGYVSATPEGTNIASVTQVVRVHVQDEDTVSAEEPRHAAADLLSVVDHEDIKPADRVFLDKVLRRLPATCRDNLRHIVVRYPKAGEKIPRAQATSSSIVIRGGMSKMETAAVITHECGHIVDLGELKGTHRAGESRYPDGHVATYNNDESVRFYSLSWQNSTKRRWDAAKTHFASQYAKHDPFEDFAEWFTLYALQQETAKALAESDEVMARKYDFMKKYVFSEWEPPASEDLKLGKKRVWDITKMAHQLISTL